MICGFFGDSSGKMMLMVLITVLEYELKSGWNQRVCYKVFSIGRKPQLFYAWEHFLPYVSR